MEEVDKNGFGIYIRGIEIQPSSPNFFFRGFLNSSSSSSFPWLTLFR